MPETENKTNRGKLNAAKQYLSEMYHLRYNVIKGITEYRPIDGEAQWRRMDDTKMNSIYLDMDAEGIKCGKDDLKIILNSEFCEIVNPVKSYFEHLPKWDGRDHIGKLADTVNPLGDKGRWKRYFEKWLTAMVANVFIEHTCANHTMLVLIGDQGCGKTTWLSRLVPPDIDSYGFTGTLDLRSKDTQTLVSEYLLINIDEQIRDLGRIDENKLKSMITIPKVSYRRPYDTFVKDYPHLASMCASANHEDFLTDSTGNRRYLAFKVKECDFHAINDKIDLNDVYAQAYHQFRNGYKYHFAESEVEEINEANFQFMISTQENEFIQEYFRTPTMEEKDKYPNKIHYYTNSMLLSILQKRTQLKLSSKRLGESLKKLGFMKKQITIDGDRQWRYELVEKDADERSKFDNIHRREIHQNHF